MLSCQHVTGRIRRAALLLATWLLPLSSAVADSVPDPFTFEERTNVGLSTVVVSNTVALTGLDENTTITIVGGEYSLSCLGPFTSAPGTIGQNGRVCVRHTTASTNCGVTDTVLTVGGVSGTFTSTTISLGIDYFDVAGETAVAENACPAWVPGSNQDDCSFNASNPSGLGVDQWIGPVFSAGYYAPGAAPGIFTSDEPPAPVIAPAPVLPTGGKRGIPLSRGFLSINDNCTVGDPSDDLVAGTLEFGAFQRNVAIGPTQRVLESFEQIVHRLAGSRVSAAVPNASGGIDYVIGQSAGASLYPSLISGSTTAGAGFADDFPSEVGSQSSGSGDDVPYWLAPGSGGIAGFEGSSAVTGSRTIAIVLGYACDDGTTSGSCGSSPINWSWDQPAGFENVILRFSTDSNANITSAEGFLVQTNELSPAIDGPDSWQATTLTASGARDLRPDAYDDRLEILSGLDATVTLAPLVNDVPGATPITLSVATQPAHGTAVIPAEAPTNIVYTLTPGDDFLGLDPFTYRITDNNGETSTGTVVVTITDPIVCTVDSASTDQNTAATIAVLTNDTGVNLPPITVGIAVPPESGTAVVNPDNTITYSPPAGEGGLFTFEYSVSEAIRDVPAQCSVFVRVDSLPVAVDDVVTAEADTKTKIDVLANDTGRDDSPVVITITQAPAHGEVEVVAAAASTLAYVNYTPTSGYEGPDTFSYDITDADGDRSNTATVAVTVRDSVPLAVDDSLPRAEDGVPTTIDILKNDTGLSDQPVTIIFAERPAHGTVVVVPGTGTALPTVTYTSTVGYVGPDQFRYRVTDVDGDRSNIATVSIVVADSVPVAVNDNRTVEDAILARIDVLENDDVFTGSDKLQLRDAPLTIRFPTRPTHGVVAFVEGTGTSRPYVTYASTPGYLGPDSFTYRITDADGSVSNVATVSVTVQDAVPSAVNDAVTVEDGVASDINVLANDSGLSETPVAISVVRPAEHGTVELLPRGATPLPSVRYVSTAGYTGPDSFRYRVTDNDGDTSNAATVTITVEDSTPVAVNDTVTAESATANQFPVLANDTGLVDTPLRITFPVLPDHGTAVATTDPATGQPRVTYTVTDGYTGPDSFRYRITDADGDRSDAATVTITVRNSVPVAADDGGTVQDGVAALIPVLDNDTQLANTPLRLTFTQQPAHGALQIVTDPDTGLPAASYTATPGYAGPDSFRYRVTDSDGDRSNEATVTLTVEDAADPVAVDDSASVEAGIETPIHVLDNDNVFVDTTRIELRDPPLRITIPTPPAHGTVATATDLLTGRPIVYYTGAAGYTGADSFGYRVTDGDGDRSNTATVTLSVSDNTLVAVDDTRTAEDDVATPIDVLGNDLGLADKPLRVIVTEEPLHGELEPVTNPETGLPALSYTAEAGYDGADAFRYRVVDADGDRSNAALVSITVEDTAPEVVADKATVEDGVTAVINVLANDTGLDDGPSTIIITSDPVHGEAEVVSDPDFGSFVTYTPDAGYEGPDTLAYRVRDSDGDASRVASVTITVRDSVPVAADDIASADVRDPQRKSVVVLANDTGLVDTPVTVEISEAPGHGAAEVTTDPGTGQTVIAYGSESGFSGTDVLRYRIRDADGDRSNAGTLTLIVSDTTPVAADDFPVLEDETAGTIDVLANDVSYTNRPLVLTIVEQPAHGSAEVITDSQGRDGLPSIRYTPAAGYTGSDALRYRITDADGDASNVADVSFTVKDSVPVANFDSANGDARDTGQPEDLAAVDVLANDTGLTDRPLTVEITGQPQHGRVELATVVVVPGNPPQTRPGLAYASDVDFEGTDTIRYRIRDADGDLSEETTLQMTIADETPFAVADTVPAQPPLGTPEGFTIERLPVGIDVLRNDTGRGNRPLEIDITEPPAHGTLVIETVPDVKPPRPGVIYRPRNGYTGLDRFEYRVKDADGDFSNVATVEFTVVNILTAASDNEATARDTRRTVKILENDGGLADGPISIEIVTELNGTAVVNSDNTVTFTPAPGFVGVFPSEGCQPPSCNPTGGGGFRYKITDASNRSDEAGVFIDVFPAAVTDSGGSSTVDPAWLTLLAAGELVRRRRRRSFNCRDLD